MNLIPHELLASAAVGALYALAFGLAELLHRRRGVEIETTRKIVHVLGGWIALLLPVLFLWHWTVPILGGLFAVALVLTRRARLLDSVHRVERTSAGEILYPIGIAATYLLSSYWGRPVFYASAVMSLALADAAAGLVGSRWGRHRFRVFGDAKSVEGSAAFLLCAFCVVLAALVLDGVLPFALILPFAAVAAVAGMCAELLAPRGSDNLAVPLVVWGTLLFLDYPTPA